MVADSKPQTRKNSRRQEVRTQSAIGIQLVSPELGSATEQIKEQHPTA